MKIPEEKTSLTHPVPSILKSVIEIKNDLIFIFTLLCGVSERFHLLEAPKRSMKIKNLCHFSPLFQWTTRVKTVFCRTPDL